MKKFVGLVFFSFLTGCMITPIYQTTEIKKGTNVKIGMAYQCGDYTSDSLTYKYNFVRIDVPFEHSLNNWSSLLFSPYFGFGKGERYYYTVSPTVPGGWCWNTLIRKNYIGSYLALKLSPFGNWRIAPAVIVGASFGRYISINSTYDDGEWVKYVEFMPLKFDLLIGIKNSKKEEWLTLGLQNNGQVLPGTIFIIYTPKRFSDKMQIFFGTGLYPLWLTGVELIEKEMYRLADFTVGVGFKLNK